MSGITPYIGVILYESTSDAPSGEPMYQEDFVLLFAESEEAARTLALATAKDQEATYENEAGERITWTLKHIVDVSPALTADFSRGGDLYTRYFRDYESYRRMEPLLGGKPL